MTIFKNLDSILAALEANPEIRYVYDKDGDKILYEDFMTMNSEGYEDDDIEDFYGDYEEDDEGFVYIKPHKEDDYSVLEEQRMEFVKNRLNEIFGDGNPRLYHPFTNVNMPLSNDKKKGEPISQKECYDIIDDILNILTRHFKYYINEDGNVKVDILDDAHKEKFEKNKSILKNYKPLTYKNYLKGIYEIHGDKRIFKISSLLNTINKNMFIIDNYYRNLDDVIKTFNLRGQALTENLMVCISRHPLDIAAVSSGQRWTSCMTLPGYHPERTEGGQYYTAVQGDIVAGTIVAYLISENGKDLKLPKPYARLSAKPFVLYNNDSEIIDMFLVNEKKVYSDNTLNSEIYQEFSSFFTSWLNDIQTPIAQLGMYERLDYVEVTFRNRHLNRELYPDSTQKKFLNFNINKIKTENDAKKLLQMRLSDLASIDNNVWKLDIVKNYIARSLSIIQIIDLNKICKLDWEDSKFFNIIANRLKNKKIVNGLIGYTSKKMYVPDIAKIAQEFFDKFDFFESDIFKNELKTFGLHDIVKFEDVLDKQTFIELFRDKLKETNYIVEFDNYRVDLLFKILKANFLNLDEKKRFLNSNLNTPSDIFIFYTLLKIIAKNDSEYLENEEVFNLFFELDYTKDFFKNKYYNTTNKIYTDSTVSKIYYVDNKSGKTIDIKNYNVKLFNLILDSGTDIHKNFIDTRLFKPNYSFSYRVSDGVIQDMFFQSDILIYLFILYYSKNKNLFNYVKNTNFMKDTSEKVDSIIRNFYKDSKNNKDTILSNSEDYMKFVENLYMISDFIRYHYFILDNYKEYYDIVEYLYVNFVKDKRYMEKMSVRDLPQYNILKIEFYSKTINSHLSKDPFKICFDKYLK